MCACACDWVDKSVPNELVYWRKCNERKKTEENGKKVVVSLEGCCLLAAQLANWVELNNQQHRQQHFFLFVLHTLAQYLPAIIDRLLFCLVEKSWFDPIPHYFFLFIDLNLHIFPLFWQLNNNWQVVVLGYLPRVLVASMCFSTLLVWLTMEEVIKDDWQHYWEKKNLGKCSSWKLTSLWLAIKNKSVIYSLVSFWFWFLCPFIGWPLMRLQ